MSTLSLVILALLTVGFILMLAGIGGRTVFDVAVFLSIVVLLIFRDLL